MKHLPALLVLGCALVCVNGARAETVTTRLTPKKTSDHLYTFTIKVERVRAIDTGKYLQFHVTVKPKPENTHPLPHRAGTLLVYAGKEFISSCDVQSTERKGELLFSFKVATKHAEKSKFMFAESHGPESERGGFYYWFYLADFVDPK